mgnify:CR=1 FL=1
MEILKNYDEVKFREFNQRFIELDDIVNRPTYLIYSFARLKGVLATRDWWYQDNDPENYTSLNNYTGENVVFRDDSGIIIRLY